MKRKVLLLMAIAPLLCGCSWIFGPQITGRWEGIANVEMYGPGRIDPIEIILVLAEDHGIITGTLRCPAVYMDPADVTGTLSGWDVEFESTILGDVSFEGTVHKRTMRGTCTYHGVTDIWEATRGD